VPATNRQIIATSASGAIVKSTGMPPFFNFLVPMDERVQQERNAHECS
jgi:hypothetical protein